MLSHWWMGRCTGTRWKQSPPPQGRAEALWLVVPLGKDREDLAPAKTLRACQSRYPKKEAPLSLPLHAGWGSATLHMEYFQELLTSGPSGRCTNYGYLCYDLFP